MSLQGVEILLTQALQEQHSDIGWLQFIQGKLSQHWLRAYKITLHKSKENFKACSTLGQTSCTCTLVHGKVNLGTSKPGNSWALNPGG